MTFVRLAGCNAPALGLGCVRWCDTSGSWEAGSGTELFPEEIADRVGLPRLCLTGGEPLLQAEGVVALVAAAHARGIRVHLETNGTLDPPRAAAGQGQRDGQPAVRGEGRVPGGSAAEPLFDWAVVSPKPPDYFIAPGWGGIVDELKLVTDEWLDAATAERLAAAHAEAIISIQPVWVGDSGPAARRAYRLVMDHPEWRLSLQTHKYLGIR